MILVYHEQLAQEVITTRLHKVAAGQLNGEFTHILKTLLLLPPAMVKVKLYKIHNCPQGWRLSQLR